MSGLLIKDFPPELHRRLKEEAARHHRSMTWQALALLEEVLSGPAKNAADPLPKPIRHSSSRVRLVTRRRRSFLESVNDNPA